VTTTELLTTGRAPGTAGLPRLLAGVGPDGATVELRAHLRRWGPVDPGLARRRLIDELEASGLAGRGGAAFPAAAKWRAVRAAGRPVVVANGAEGEPASAKDAVLLSRNPHLVLDGAQAAALALGARRVVVYVPARLVPVLRRAVATREAMGVDPVEVEVFVAANAFVAGQESAVVNALNGRGDALPGFQGITPVRVRGVAGRPTLVHNVETLAHVALIARFGAGWFRSVGTAADPGSTLLTVTEGARGPVVLEVPQGIALARVVDLGATNASRFQGALLGGYGGSWVPVPTLGALELSETGARRIGATLGPGIVVLLERSVCPLSEVASVVRYMHGQAAGQCGPCVHGLGGLDEALEALARRPAALRGGTEGILELCGLVHGRGACRHPDGVARFVASALEVFADDVAAHLGAGPCHRVGRTGVLALGRPRPRVPCSATGGRR
jgi:NADH:ubiquinone oxidoreductase subunit F (NADH-binding)